VQPANQRGLVGPESREHGLILTKSTDRVNNRPIVQDGAVQISARADYALRALCVLASAPDRCAVKADDIAAAQGIPRTFLDGILVELRRAGVIESRRGPEGGHRLARPAAEVTLAEVMRVVDGPLALIRGQRPETHAYDGAARHLQDVWVAVRASLRSILELTTLEQVVAGRLPDTVTAHTSQERSWRSIWPPPTDT
jgi:Rrf2 family protein